MPKNSCSAIAFRMVSGCFLGFSAYSRAAVAAGPWPSATAGRPNCGRGSWELAAAGQGWAVAGQGVAPAGPGTVAASHGLATAGQVG